MFDKKCVFISVIIIKHEKFDINTKVDLKSISCQKNMSLYLRHHRIYTYITCTC